MPLNIVRSRKLIEVSDDSVVNLMFGWNWFMADMKLLRLYFFGQMRKMSSISLVINIGCSVIVFKNFRSNTDMKILAIVGRRRLP